MVCLSDAERGSFCAGWARRKLRENSIKYDHHELDSSTMEQVEEQTQRKAHICMQDIQRTNTLLCWNAGHRGYGIFGR